MYTAFLPRSRGRFQNHRVIHNLAPVDNAMKMEASPAGF
jgi:hypothetical protein